ncbi:UBX domain protein [Zalerion maritima]|uniref:UBX domain protein n=1 Tax=Zalerion maritima TaxID=339359 RepID=A0AAD5S0W0_9PEZI|nr:UBX domain protein [Zalerion maritima]
MTTSDLQMLLEMGFDPTRADIAIKKSGNLNGAIEWLEKNQDKTIEVIQAESKAAAEEEARPKTNVESLKEGEDNAKSLVCNECGKKFRSMEAAEFHASKTEHTDFAESTEEIVALTEEQKKQHLEELREKLKAKKATQSEADKAEAKKNEKIRMKSTRETADLKEEVARKTAMEEAAKKRKEQAEDREYKKRLLAQIETDKKERKRKFEEEKARREGRLPQYEGGPSQSPAQALAASQPKSSPSDVRLKLMVGGKPVMKRFGPETTLFEVVEDLKKDGTVENVDKFVFKLANKSFDSLDFGQTLAEAGLAPSAILAVE